MTVPPQAPAAPCVCQTGAQTEKMVSRSVNEHSCVQYLKMHGPILTEDLGWQHQYSQIMQYVSERYHPQPLVPWPQFRLAQGDPDMRASQWCAKHEKQHNLKLSQVSGDQLVTYNASGYQTIYHLGDGACCSTGYVLQVLPAGEWNPPWCCTGQGPPPCGVADRT